MAIKREEIKRMIWYLENMKRDIVEVVEVLEELDDELFEKENEIERLTAELEEARKGVK